MSITQPILPRSAGCFLHISSLPSEQGIGCFDEHAKSFINFLKMCGMSYWQICPLTPTSIGNSPYQGVSAFAGNPYFINLKELVSLKLLERSELSTLRNLPSDHVDFSAIYEPFWAALQQAYNRFVEIGTNFDDFHKFVQQESYWLEDYSLFMSLKMVFKGIEWTKWPKKFRSSKSAKKNIQIFPHIDRTVRFYQFVQWIFFKQWQELRNHANKSGIKIIGDVPIFVGLDSADVWANQQFFKLNKLGSPTVVAGVPPDAFSKTGQLWGNPVFNWRRLKYSGYKWWINRLQHSFKLYDVARLDHFRGFQANWEVKSGEATAEHGKWVKTAGKHFFTGLNKKLPNARFIAEDLGVIDDETQKLLSFTKFPGMNVLQFAFDGQPNNKYLPHCHQKNSILYLGTHDNDTTHGWFDHLQAKNKGYVRDYLRTDCSDVTWDMIKLAYGSVANLLILTMPDILNLGSEARFNTPNTMNSNNWAWRVTDEQLEQIKRYKTDNYLRFLATTYGRMSNE
ncbi:MAG: 4-alpha-glucanotransferase [Opitutales bacterium]|nr:4-alpha-glucanotransferase [Opitutales bacterium]